MTCGLRLNFAADDPAAVTAITPVNTTAATSMGTLPLFATIRTAPSAARPNQPRLGLGSRTGPPPMVVPGTRRDALRSPASAERPVCRGHPSPVSLGAEG